MRIPGGQYTGREGSAWESLHANDRSEPVWEKVGRVQSGTL